MRHRGQVEATVVTRASVVNSDKIRGVSSLALVRPVRGLAGVSNSGLFEWLSGAWRAGVRSIDSAYSDRSPRLPSSYIIG